MSTQAFTPGSAPYFAVTNAHALTTAVPQQVGINLGALAPAGFWTAVASDGSDIRVTNSAGTTEYAYRLAEFSKVGTSGWILLDGQGLSTSVDVTLRVYVATSLGKLPATECCTNPALFILDSDLESSIAPNRGPIALSTNTSGTIGTTTGLIGQQLDVSAGAMWYQWASPTQTNEGEVAGCPTNGTINTGFANTGLALHPTLAGGSPAFIIGAFNSTGASAQIQVYAAGNTSTLLDSFTVGYQMQGIAVDGAGIVWVTDTVGQRLIGYNPVGWSTFATISTTGFAPNSLWYRSDTDRLYLYAQGGTTVRIYKPSDGSSDGTTSLPYTDVDGVTWWAAQSLLLLTRDPGDLVVLNSSGVPQAYYQLSSLLYIEHLVVYNGKIWICNDAGYHGPVANGNRLWSVPDTVATSPTLPASLVRSSFSFRVVLTTGAVTGTDAIAGYGNPVSASTVGWGLYTTGTTNLRLFTNSGAGAVFTDRTVAAARHVVHLVMDRTTPQALMYVDGAQAGAAITLASGDLIKSSRRLSLGDMVDGDISRAYDGKLDQAMWRAGVMSSAEVATEYNWLTNQASYWTAGAWTVPSNAGAGTVAGAGVIVGVGLSVRRGIGAINGSGAVNGAGKSSRTGAGPVTGVGAVAGVGSAPTENPTGAGSVAGTGSLVGVGSSARQGLGSVAGAGAVAGAGFAPSGVPGSNRRVFTLPVTRRREF